MDLVGVDRDRGNVARRAIDRLAGHGVAVIHITIDPSQHRQDVHLQTIIQYPLYIHLSLVFPLSRIYRGRNSTRSTPISAAPPAAPSNTAVVTSRCVMTTFFSLKSSRNAS